MEVHAVDDRPHAVLTDAEVQVAAAVGAGLVDVVGAVDQGQRARRQVGGAADELGHLRRGPLQHLVARLARGDHALVGVEARRLGAGEAVGQAAREQPLELRALVRVGVLVGGEALLPLGLALLAPVDGRAEVLQRLVGHEERLVRRASRRPPW